MALSDQQFLQQLADLNLDPQYFDHYGHLRLAWLVLQAKPLEQAVSRVCELISAYATSLGATDKFQYTLTAAIVRIMAELRHQQGWHGQNDRLDDFLAANPLLQQDLMSLVLKHYQPETLNSPIARQQWLEPDRLAFGGE